MSEIIEQQVYRKITPCGWNAKEIWLAVIGCPVRDFDSGVFHMATGSHRQKA
jgi:hypothetical protein